MNKKVTYEILAYDMLIIDRDYVLSYYTLVNGQAEFLSKMRELKKLYDKIVWHDNKNRCGCWKKKRMVK